MTTQIETEQPADTEAASFIGIGKTFEEMFFGSQAEFENRLAAYHDWSAEALHSAIWLFRNDDTITETIRFLKNAAVAVIPDERTSQTLRRMAESLEILRCEELPRLLREFEEATQRYQAWTCRNEGTADEAARRAIELEAKHRCIRHLLDIKRAEQENLEKDFPSPF